MTCSSMSTDLSSCMAGLAILLGSMSCVWVAWPSIRHARGCWTGWMDGYVRAVDTYLHKRMQKDCYHLVKECSLQQSIGNRSWSAPRGFLFDNIQLGCLTRCPLLDTVIRLAEFHVFKQDSLQCFLALYSINPTIFNIICWVAGLLGQTNDLTSVWSSKY